MVPKISVSIPVNQLSSKVGLLISAINFTKIEDEAAAVLLNRIRTNFLAERAPDGSKWKPSKAGLARRAKGGTGTLFKTGRLFRSIQLSRQGSRLAVGSDVEYGVKHQLGLDGLPVRQFIGVTQADADAYELVLAKRLSGLV